MHSLRYPWFTQAFSSLGRLLRSSMRWRPTAGYFYSTKRKSIFHSFFRVQYFTVIWINLVYALSSRWYFGPYLMENIVRKKRFLIFLGVFLEMSCCRYVLREYQCRAGPWVEAMFWFVWIYPRGWQELAPNDLSLTLEDVQLIIGNISHYFVAMTIFFTQKEFWALHEHITFSCTSEK
jgi:hypothetical protein